MPMGVYQHKPHSAETKAKMSAVRKGRPQNLTQEQRAARAERTRRQMAEPNANVLAGRASHGEQMRGRTLSEEHKTALRGPRKDVVYSDSRMRHFARVLVSARPHPWYCAHCGGEVLVLSIHDGIAHHQDENPQNNSDNNLVFMHHRCHVSHHTKGLPRARKGLRRIESPA